MYKTFLLRSLLFQTSTLSKHNGRRDCAKCYYSVVVAGSNNVTNPDRKPVRVRFAPSPTGHLHLGGFRTALLNYLFAKKNNGTFLLRIEDTDQDRAVAGTANLIEDDLEWLHLSPDESPRKGGPFGPYTQSERLHHYETFVAQLIKSGHAYQCFCSEKRLELMKKNAVRQRTKPMYDNKCKDLSAKQVSGKISAGEPYCVRFKLPPPPYHFEDYIQGSVTINQPEGDFVILKSDKYPTYHLACIVDDHLMEISHVLRGIEWQVSTGKHLSLYNALGLQPPIFAHLPLLRNSDGTKLSKRQGDISIEQYRKLNYYPNTLINFVMGHNTIESFESIMENFDIKSLSTDDRKLDFRCLDDLNQLYLKQISSSPELREENLAILKSVFPKENEDYYQRLLEWCPERVAKLQDVGQLYPFLSTHCVLDSEVSNDKITKEELRILQIIICYMESKLKLQSGSEGAKFDSNDWKTIASENNVGIKLFMSVFRRAICGLEEGPPINEIIHLLGSHEVLERLKRTRNTNLTLPSPILDKINTTSR